MKEVRQLADYLRHPRKPVGPGGFEGLIARLLENLTDQRFFLAHAGAQDGRDMSTGGFEGTWVAVEAKLFKSPRSFSKRSLMGEFAELPADIDLWIIASTTRVPEQVISALREKAKDRGIDVETLDLPLDRLGDLAVLCAAYSEVVESFLDEARVVELLVAIQQHAEFNTKLERLRDRFRIGSIGYSQARSASLSYLRSAFEDSGRARVHLGQPINVLENGGHHVVERRQALDALDSWWESWSVTHQRFVLLGEEGMGKTWALASWLARKLAPQTELPLTLFLPSRVFDTTTVLNLVADALTTCTGVRDARFWAKRAKAFAGRPIGARPAVLLILDGLNEQPQFDWRTLLEELQLPPWQDHVATVLTCRPAYWQEELVYMGNGSSLFQIEPYDDLELASAVEKGGEKAANLPSSLESLLRLPRYFDLAILHREAIEQSGDVTVDRLLYEDWKHRVSRKPGLMSDLDFRAFLTQLAEEHQDRLSKRQIQDLLPAGDGFLISLDEIITGGICDRDNLGRYTVAPQRMIQSFGIVLADRVQRQSQRGELAMREAMSYLLEPHADMDRKVAICRSAVTFAVLEPEFPEAARSVLFEKWIESRNLSRQDTDSFIAYLPASVESYLSLVEKFWSARKANRYVQRLLVHAFFRWRGVAQVQQTLARTCERWFSYVDLNPHRLRKDGVRDQYRKQIEERAGRSLKKGDRFFLGDELEVDEDGTSLLFSSPALLLISLLPVEPFIPALRRWALSRSLMDVPYDANAVAWLLRFSSEDIWPTLSAAVCQLLEGLKVAQQAAWKLLWYCGREEAARMIERLPIDLFPPSPSEEAYAEDPCRWFWRYEDCTMCVSRPDLPDRLIALRLAPHCRDPKLSIPFNVRPRLQRALSGIQVDRLWSGPATRAQDIDFRDMEPALAAFVPDLLAKTYRTLIRSLPSRSEKDRYFLLALVDSTTALLQGSKELRAIRSAWEEICCSESWDDEKRYAENELFAAILFHVSSEDQLDLLLRRPEQAFDDIQLGWLFKRLPTKCIRRLAQNLLASKPLDLQRKLWFLCYQPATPVIETLGTEWIIGLLDHTDRKTRVIAEDWLFRSGCDEAFDLAIERGIITPSSTRLRHQWFAVRMKSHLSYTNLVQAIDLGSLSYVIQKRPGELTLYTQDLDRAIRIAAGRLNENLENGFCEATLRAIVKQSPEIVADWTRLARDQREKRLSPLLKSCHMLLEQLCKILLETEPSLGVDLFQTLLAQRQYARTIDDPTDVDVLAISLFMIPESEHCLILLREWLENCKTDKALFELALAAIVGRNSERLEALIEEGISSHIPVRQAAAITLAGFSIHCTRSEALLESIKLHPKGWLQATYGWARRQLDRDCSAQEWFRRFATSPSKEEAFGAFRLFLRCVDRRYWAWKDNILRSADPVRRRYWRGNREAIDKAIRDNEEYLEKHFLGDDLAEDKVYPWLPRYFG